MSCYGTVVMNFNITWEEIIKSPGGVEIAVGKILDGQA